MTEFEVHYIEISFAELYRMQLSGKLFFDLSDLGITGELPLLPRIDTAHEYVMSDSLNSESYLQSSSSIENAPEYGAENSFDQDTHSDEIRAPSSEVEPYNTGEQPSSDMHQSFENNVRASDSSVPSFPNAIEAAPDYNQTTSDKYLLEGTYQDQSKNPVQPSTEIRDDDAGVGDMNDSSDTGQSSHHGTSGNLPAENATAASSTDVHSEGGIPPVAQPNVESISPIQSTSDGATEQPSQIEPAIPVQNGRFIRGYNSQNGHFGIDIAPPERGTNPPVQSPYAGQISRIGWQNPSDHNQGFGFRVYIAYNNGMTGIFAHLVENSPSTLNLNVYDMVTAGQQIGLMGTTGESTGVHLHYEERVNNNPQNPTGVRNLY